MMAGDRRLATAYQPVLLPGPGRFECIRLGSRIVK